MQEKENSLGASPEKLTANADRTQQRIGQVEETKFSQVVNIILFTVSITFIVVIKNPLFQVYRTLKLPNTLPPKMSENLSVSLAFLGEEG